jgi:hypothetical protein
MRSEVKIRLQKVEAPGAGGIARELFSALDFHFCNLTSAICNRLSDFPVHLMCKSSPARDQNISSAFHRSPKIRRIRAIRARFHL